MHPHSPNNLESRSRWPREQNTRIGVIAAGEVGLRLALDLAERGYNVVCADHRADRIAARPADLAERLDRSAGAGRLRLTSSSAVAARYGQVIVMAVTSRSGLERDQAAVLDAAIEVAQNLAGPAVIVDQSTNSAASAERVARLLAGIARHDIVVVPGSRPDRRER